MVTAVSSGITVGGCPTQTQAGVYGYPSSRQETVFIHDYLLQS